MLSPLEVPVYDNVCEDTFKNHIYLKRVPALLRGSDIGQCVNKWTCEYLIEKIGDATVKAHVSTEPKLNFITKNFVYKALTLSELVKRASTEQLESSDCTLNSREFYYLRSLGDDPRGRNVANIIQQFPEIADDIVIPKFFQESEFFSSVFRIASKGVQLWTHYDIMDNILIQINGRKRMVLYSPEEALNMYMIGDKSQVTDIDNPDTAIYPLFIKSRRYVCYMEPGDILFIPALWFHNALALDFGIAVNVFWRHLPNELYDKKDPYGNKDLVPAARALQMIENATKSIDVLPDAYKKFYARRMIALLENKYLSVI